MTRGGRRRANLATSDTGGPSPINQKSRTLPFLAAAGNGEWAGTPPGALWRFCLTYCIGLIIHQLSNKSPMPPLLVIDHHNGVPAYRQIMDQLKLQIAMGVLAPGAEMPSTRALSAELALNPMTISKAYSLLEHDGVLERRRGQTLVVRAVEAAEGKAARLDLLRAQLAAASSLSRQLDVPKGEALKLFKRILDETQ
jgi:GntR family transcriptional regulator